MSQLEFKYIHNIVYIVVPLSCLVLLIAGYRKKEMIMNNLKLKINKKLKWIKIITATLGIGLIFFSLLGPQSYSGVISVNRSGLDIYILIDTSKSMLVEDIQPDRISKSKKIIENIIDNLEGDKIGFIPFASSAYVQMPLTYDYDMAKMFLEVVDTDMIGGGGSNVAEAIKLADKSFSNTSGSDKVVIIISDGEENNTDSESALKSIENKDMIIYTIGVGTENGGLIPEYDSKGQKVTGYKKDFDGQYITSKLNDQTLKKLASETGGKYYKSSVSGNASP